MSYRYMRVIVMFDLPSVSSEELKEYRKFRKFLLKSGFVMMQESVYTKIASNTSVSNGIVRNIRKNKPSRGLVQVLVVTEKQFARIEYIVGQGQSEYIDTDERLIIL